MSNKLEFIRKRRERKRKRQVRWKGRHETTRNKNKSVWKELFSAPFFLIGSQAAKMRVVRQLLQLLICLQLDLQRATAAAVIYRGAIQFSQIGLRMKYSARGFSACQVAAALTRRIFLTAHPLISALRPCSLARSAAKVWFLQQLNILFHYLLRRGRCMYRQPVPIWILAIYIRPATALWQPVMHGPRANITYSNGAAVLYMREAGWLRGTFRLVALT